MPMVSEVVLRNESLGYDMTFKESNRDLILESVDLGVIEAIISSQDIIGHDGTHVTSVRYKSRTISLEVWLVGRDDVAISVLRRGLNAFINPKQRLTIKQNGYQITGVPLHTALYGNSIQVLNEKMCKCLIEVMCDDPLFLRDQDSTVGISAWDNKLVFPLVFELADDTMIFGLRADTKTMVVENKGDVPVGALFTFVATGSVDTPKITNIATQEVIEINSTMGIGDTILVDTRGKIITAELINSSGESDNIINLLSTDRKKMMIPLGEGRFVYSAVTNSDNLEVTITFSEKFLEVL